MTEKQKAKKLAKAKRIVERCVLADVKPARWVVALLEKEKAEKAAA